MAGVTAMTVQLNRMDRVSPWGFRLQGGRDFRMALSVKKVEPRSPADGQLHSGDAILAIDGYDASQMTHAQAQQMIRNSGNTLQLTVNKGLFQSLKPTGPIKFSPAAAYGYSHGHSTF
ncbi:DgyrCDS9480 [Dimorphilus gyrociliatus]|uniref:DgyrCDS9480 n=1 Tax=Dimorphilus gyrociliatus TaxID=2664684 RepID=A0A7I8W2E1_9ANNE|nr:DgyrCDS9480 [Dimorphilus gyrociliatus]